MHFPFEAPTGKRIPLRDWIPGRSFRRGPKKESTSRSERQFWDVISAEGSKQKAPARDGAEAKGAAYVVDAEREQLVNNGCPHPTLPAATGAAVRRIHHGQIGTQLAVKRAVGVLYGGRRGNRCDLADALAAICHGQ